MTSEYSTASSAWVSLEYGVATLDNGVNALNGPVSNSFSLNEKFDTGLKEATVVATELNTGFNCGESYSNKDNAPPPSVAIVAETCRMMSMGHPPDRRAGGKGLRSRLSATFCDEKEMDRVLT